MYIYMYIYIHICTGKKVGELLGPFAKSGKCKVGLNMTVCEGDKLYALLEERSGAS